MAHNGLQERAAALNTPVNELTGEIQIEIVESQVEQQNYFQEHVWSWYEELWYDDTYGCSPCLLEPYNGEEFRFWNGPQALQEREGCD